MRPKLGLPQEKKKGSSGVKQLRGHQAIPHHPMKAIFIGISCSYVWFNNLQEKLRSFFNYQLALILRHLCHPSPNENDETMARRCVGSLTLQKSTLKCGRFSGPGDASKHISPEKKPKKTAGTCQKKGCKHFLKGEIHLQVP